MPGKEMNTVANCEGWRQPTRLFSGWALVQIFSSLCLVHTGFLVLKEAVADWSEALCHIHGSQAWLSCGQLALACLGSYCSPPLYMLCGPSSPFPKRTERDSSRVWYPKGEALPVILLVSLSAGYRIDFEGQIMAQGRVKTQRLSYFSITSPWRFPFPAGTYRNGSSTDSNQCLTL